MNSISFSPKLTPRAGHSGAPVDLSDKLNFKTRFARFKMT
jgi:hypothetical protein